MTVKELKAKAMQLLAEAEEIQKNTPPDIDAFEAKMGELVEVEGAIEKAEKYEASSEQFRAMQARYRTNSDPPPVQNISKRQEGSFESFGHYLQAVARTAITGQRDDRLEQFRVKGGSEQHAILGMSETIPSDGGFLVDKDQASDMLTQALSQSILYPRCRKIPISGNSNGVKFNAIDETSRATGSRWGGVQVYWATEAPTYTSKKPKFRQVELSLKKLIGLCYATDELLQDAAALQAVISQAFADEFAFVIDDAVIRGTGAGQPQGILNASCTVSQAKETDQEAGVILYQNVIKMDSRLAARSANSPGTVWLINQNCKPQLMQMGVVVGTGGAPVWLPAGGASGKPYSTLLGRDVIPIEQCETVGTVGDIILFDGNGYVIAEKGGLVASSSMHVQFTTDEMTYKFTQRLDGQPMDASAKTPYKGGSTSTTSCFITLATRS